MNKSKSLIRKDPKDKTLTAEGWRRLNSPKKIIKERKIKVKK